MGRLIDESLLQEKLALIPMEERTFRRTVEELENAPTVEAIPVTEKAFEMFETDYKNRLKADMVAMLEVIKLRIDNLPEPLNRDRVNYCIQEKINELRGKQDENNNEI